MLLLGYSCFNLRIESAVTILGVEVRLVGHQGLPLVLHYFLFVIDELFYAMAPIVVLPRQRLHLFTFQLGQLLLQLFEV